MERFFIFSTFDMIEAAIARKKARKEGNSLAVSEGKRERAGQTRTKKEALIGYAVDDDRLG